MIKFLKNLFNGFIIAGIIIFLIGVDYWMFRAGLPYQDPPMELQIQYAIDQGIGDTLMSVGFEVGIIGVVSRIVTAIVSRRKAKQA